MKLSDQIRRAVDESGLSRYRICKDLGIPESSLSRFMAGHGAMSLQRIDELAEYLGLELKRRSRPASVRNRRQ